MNPLAAAALLQALGGVGQGIGAAVANAQDPMGPRIREIKAAQARGGLTRTGQLAVEAGQGEDLQALDTARRGITDTLAATGATSGKDIAAAAAANQQAAQTVADKAAQRWRDAYAKEDQELADRQAIRRDRTMEIVNDVTGQASQAAAAYGAHEGAFQKGLNGPVDADAAAKNAGVSTDQARAWASVWNSLTPGQRQALLAQMGQ